MAAVNPAQPLPKMITFSTYQSSMSRKSAKVAGVDRPLRGRCYFGAEGAVFLYIELATGRVRPTGGQGTARSTFERSRYPRNLRYAGAGRSRMVSQTVGRRARRGDCRSWLARAEPRLSRERRARASAKINRRKTSQLARARKTDAL